MSSQTKRTKPLGDQNLLEDDDEPSCDAFMNSQSGEIPQKPSHSVDGLFTIVTKEEDVPFDEENGGMDSDQASSDSDDDLTFNS